MKKLFNIFKKKPKKVEKVKDHYNSELMRYTINNKEYAIADSQIIKIQSVADDVSVYGWSLEVRWKDTSGEWYNWMTYWNHRIYASRSSALDAATKIYPSYKEGYEWRIVPLYKMNEPQFRDYKIDQLLKPEAKRSTKVYEIKAWKLKEDSEVTYERTRQTFKYTKGTLFIQMEDGQIKTIKDQTTGIKHHDRFQLFNDLLKNEQVEEVNIQNEKWAHPHLCKELKLKLKK